MHFYLDESGDLGWKFHKPYRFGGSSRYLTIGVLQIPGEKAHLTKRLIKKLYKKYSWDTSKEKKWSEMKDLERKEFALQARKMVVKHPDIRYWAMVVKKQNVQAHIREDVNKLYNYMIKLLLTKEMSRHSKVRFVPDPRSIKVESGNSLHDYLQAELWFEHEVSTTVITAPEDSNMNINVQFADMLSGVVQHHFEDTRSVPYQQLRGKIQLKRLYHS